MAKRKAVESRWQAILDITLVPAVARLPPAVAVERRNVLARHALLCRIHSEFEEMPGLSLTSIQAARSSFDHCDGSARSKRRACSA